MCYGEVYCAEVEKIVLQDGLGNGLYLQLFGTKQTKKPLLDL